MINKISVFVFFLLIVGCKKNSSNITNNKIIDKKVTINTTTDSVCISNYPSTRLFVSKEEYNEITSQRKEFFLDKFIDPDSTYFSYLKNGNNTRFESEFGKDTYFLWYTYFIKMKYNASKYQKERQELIELYVEINNLNANLNRGGSFFAHNIPRIQAYVEWEIYKNHMLQINCTKDFKIKFSKQKSDFIATYIKLIDSVFLSDFWLNEEKNYRLSKKKEVITLFKSIENKVNNSRKICLVSNFQDKFYYEN